MISRWKLAWASLTTRLVLVMAGLVIGTALVLSALALYLLQDQLNHSAQLALDDARQSASAILQERLDETAILASFASTDPIIVEALRKQNKTELDAVAARLSLALPTAVLVIADSSGRWQTGVNSFEFDEAEVWVADAVQGQTRTGWSKTAECRFVAVTSVPIRAEGTILGAVFLAWPLDEPFIDKIKAQTQTEAWFLCGSIASPVVWGAKSLDLDSTISEYVLAQGKPSVGNSRVDGVGGYGSYTPILDISGHVIGMYGVTQRTPETVAVRDNAIRLFAGVALVLVLAVLVESLLLAHRITTPLEILTRAAHAFRKGAHPVPLPVNGNDEIAVLARSFEQMRSQLSAMYEDLAREKNRYRDFLAIMPHEFKTPLSAVVASLELLETGDAQLSPDQITLLNSIRRATIRLQGLVNNLLDTASLQAGHFQVFAEPHDLASIVEEARAFIQPVLDQRKQSLLVQSNASVPKVMADRIRITQVLINLISNASKYGPAEEPICVEIAPDGEFVRTGISDRGAGIPPEEQSLLFQRFMRVGKRNGRSVEGIGFGLAIVKGIIELHHGQVGITSAPGKGTTVWFTLPAARLSSESELDDE